MHYRNGREAKNGDKVVLMRSFGNPVIGILYDAVAGNDNCNGAIAPFSINDPCPDLKECLHLDDVLAILNPPVVTTRGKISISELEDWMNEGKKVEIAPDGTVSLDGVPVNPQLPPAAPESDTAI